MWGHFDDDHTRPGAPLFPPERRNADGTAARVGNEALRAALAAAAATHLPDWPDSVTPHVLRHFCASQLYLGGMDLVAIQETLGHAWVATTMNYVHVHRTHIEDAWIAGQQRAADRLKGSFNEVEPAAGRRQPRHLEGQRAAANACRAGLVISAGKMSGLWSGNPASIKLDDLDVICAVLGCDVQELLIAEPGKVVPITESQDEQQADAGRPVERTGDHAPAPGARTLPPA